MLFTTKTEYGMRAMVALAKNSDNKPLSLAQIAKSEKISPSYLERIFSKLKADDLVKSEKGADGGYLLARSPKQITIFDIVEALEGPLAVFYCVAKSSKKVVCTSKKCLTKKVWSELQKNVMKTLRGFTLQDLI